MGSSSTSSTTLSPETAAAQSGIYRLLARLWLHEVDRNLLRELLSRPLRDLYREADGTLPGQDDDRTIEELAVDFCRLFVGPTDHLPPYQSVWQSGQFQGVAATSMRSFIEIVGYETAPLPDGMMLDHLGVQLDVMGHILGLITTGQLDGERLVQVSEVARAFWTRHLLWPTELLDAAKERATTDFYRSSIQLTANFLVSESPAWS